MKDNKLLNLTVDISFKYYFTAQGSEEILAHFLSVALDLPLDEFSEIKVLNPTLPKESLKDKDFIVDINIKTKTGKTMHVEMQFQDHENFGGRVVAYNGRIFGSQIKRGDEYTELKEVYSIVITNFDMFPNTPHYRDVFKYTGKYGDVLTELTQIHILQLPKLPKDARTPLEYWLKLFNVSKEEDLDMIKEKAPEMDKAIRHLRVLSADEEAKYLEQERISGISLRKTLLGTARREGLAEGLAEGILKGKIEGKAEGRIEGKVELLFKDLGLPVEEIAKKLSVDEDYINTLLKELSLI